MITLIKPPKRPISPRYRYEVRREIPDMLRYDYARVIGTTPDGWMIVEGEVPPISARWKSFGVSVRNVARIPSKQD